MKKVWLTGDLTNHDDKICHFVWQNRHLSRLMLVDLNLKWCILTYFCGWNKLPSDVRTSKEEEMNGPRATWTETL